MKILLLVRHAKSNWDDPSVPDRDRPLNERGLRDAPRIGKRLAKREFNPELILSSPAVRALTTAEAIADEISYPRKDVAVNDRLYETDADALLTVIHELDDHFSRVMLFSHNPALTDLAGQLTSGKVTDIPTCGVVELSYDIASWSAIEQSKPAKVKQYGPKDKQ